ncbi:hypothetical protein I7I48_03258 [Histoplasma ohiense]|nr:hypothetical protein I7I48_03258 [Histoplasma ohiense (nom. inval.)]
MYWTLVFVAGGAGCLYFYYYYYFFKQKISPPLFSIFSFFLSFLFRHLVFVFCSLSLQLCVSVFSVLFPHILSPSFLIFDIF